MPPSVKANRFNVKKLVYAVITKDDLTSVEHGAIKVIEAGMQVQLTPTYASGTLYGGGVKTEDISKITGATVKLDINKLPIEDRAVIGGHTYAAGIMSVKASDQAPDIALGYEIEETGGHSGYTWLLKGKAKPFATTNQQSTDNINFSTDSIEIGFVPRVFDKKIHDDADTANSAFTAEKAALYLTTIPDATLTGV